MVDDFLVKAATWKGSADNVATGDIESKVRTAESLLIQAIDNNFIPSSTQTSLVIGSLSYIAGKAVDFASASANAESAVKSAERYYEMANYSGTGNELVDSVIGVSLIPAQIVAALDTVINAIGALSIIPGAAPFVEVLTAPLRVLKAALDPIAELVTANAKAAEAAWNANFDKFGVSHMVSGSAFINADYSHSIVLAGTKAEGGCISGQCGPVTKSIWGETFTGYEGATYTTYIGGVIDITRGGAGVTILGWSPNELQFNINTTSNHSSPTAACKPTPSQYGSPLILDLDGDGVEATGLAGPVVFFDIDGDGVAERTGWVGSDDGLLAIDLDGDGQIGSAAELFGAGRTISRFGSAALADLIQGDGGTQTDSPYGPVLESSEDYAQYGSGFAALAAYDSNRDNVIDATDDDFDLLRVWRDANSDGNVDAGEMMTLADAGVASISLAATHSVYEFGTNLVTDASTFRTTYGETREVLDVWFEFDQRTIRYERPEDMPESITGLPQLGPLGALKDLHVAMYEDAVLEELVREAAGLTDLGAWTAMGERILSRWAGADHVDPTSRGLFVNAQHLEVLEAVKETPFRQNGFAANPLENASGALENEWSHLHRDVTAALLLQTAFGQALFPELEMAAGGGLGLKDGASLETVLARLEAGAPSIGSDRAIYWHTALRVLEGISGSFGGFTAEQYRVRVETLLDQQGIDLGYDDVVGGRIGSDGDDVMVIQATIGVDIQGSDDVEAGFAANNFWRPQTRLVVTGAGDDTVNLTYKDAALFWGPGDGDDTIRLTGWYSEIPTGGVGQGLDGTRLFLRLDALNRADVIAEAPLELNEPFRFTIIATGETLSIEPALNRDFNAPGRVSVRFADQTLDLADLYAEVLPDATAGDDVLRQKIGQDMDGGLGDDALLGSLDAQTTYRFDIGSGQDTITDRGSAAGAHRNTIIFGPGVTLDDVRLSRDLADGTDLLISVLGAPDTLRIVDQFVAVGPLSAHAIEAFVVEGVEYSASDFEQLLLIDEPGLALRHGTEDNDVFDLDETAFAGEIRGWGGNDRYVFSSRFDDVDASNARTFRIRDEGFRTYDQVVIAETLDDLDVVLTDNALTVVVRRNGDTLVVERPETIELFSIGGQDYSLGALKDTLLRQGLIASGAAIVGTIDADAIDGTEAADLIYAFAGDDVVDGRGGADTIYAGGGLDTIDGGAGDDLIVLSDDVFGGFPAAGEAADGGLGADTITGSPLNDSIDGGADADLLSGGYGNDTYRGGAGDDVIDDILGADLYRFATGDGNDLIGEANYLQPDSIQLEGGLALASMTASIVVPSADAAAMLSSPVVAPYGLTLSFGGGDSITIVDTVSNGSRLSDITIRDGAGSTTTQARWAALNAPTSDAQTIVQADSAVDYATGAGDDRFVSLFSTIRFSWGPGDGNDTIENDWDFNPVAFDGVVSLRAGVTAADIAFSLAGEHLTDLVVRLSSGETLTILDQFHQGVSFVGSSVVETLPLISTFAFADGSTIAAADLMARFGGGSDGTAATFDGDDTLGRLAGISLYAGGSGSDTYGFNPGDGSPTILEDASSVPIPVYDAEVRQPGPVEDFRTRDTLQLGVNPGDVTVAADGDDLLITFDATGETIRIVAQLNPVTVYGTVDPQTRALLPAGLQALLGPGGAITEDFWNAPAFGDGSTYAQLFGGAPVFTAGIERFVFADGTSLNRNQILDIAGNVSTDGGDRLSTDGEGGVLDGGRGDDILEGGAGGDIYVADFRTGDDMARDSGGVDRLIFGPQVKPENVAFTRTGSSGANLLIEIDGLFRSAITIDGQFAGREIESFAFEDGTVISAEGVRQIILGGLGSGGGDDIVGFDGPDFIEAGGGDDTIEGREGADTILGGLGRDTAVFSGAADDYTVTATANGAIVTDNVGDDGADTLVNVEVLRFLGVRDGGSGAAADVALAVNLAPSAGTRVFNLTEDRVLRLRQGDLVALGSDPDGDALAVASVSDAVNGSVVRSGADIIFTPTADFVGAAGFRFVVADQGGLAAEGVITVNYAGRNDAPIVADLLVDRQSAEDEAVSFSIPADAFTDVDGPTLTLSAVLAGATPLPSWLNFDAATRTFSGTPPQDFSGALDIVVTASDGSLSASDTFRLTITPVNDAPIAPAYTLFLDEDSSAILDRSMISDADSLLFAVSVKPGFGPSHGAIETDAATDAMTYRPAADFFGEDSVTLLVSDGEATVEQVVTFAVAGVNDPIRGFGVAPAFLPENGAGGTVVATLSGVDPDGGAVTFGISGLDAAKVVVDGTLLRLAAGAVVDHEADPALDLTVTATSGGGPNAGSTDSADISIAIANMNEDLRPFATSALTVTENVAAGTVIGQLIGDLVIDPDGNAVSFAVDPASAGAALFEFVGTELVLKAGAAIDFETLGSSVEIAIVATSAGGADVASTRTQTFSVTIADAAEAPTAIGFAGGPIAENSAAGTTVGTLSASDPDSGESFAWSLIPGAGDGDNALVTLVGDQIRVNGAIDFETNPSLEIRVRATDSDGLVLERALVVAVADVGENSGVTIITGTLGADNGVSGLPLGPFGRIVGNLFPEAFRGLRGGAASDSIDGLGGADVLFGFGGSDTIQGGAGNDRIYGDRGQGFDGLLQGFVFLPGVDGADFLSGGLGDDRVWGGGGDDTLFGGQGRDTLEGGAGADRFAFDDGDSAPGLRDRIEDFSRAEGDLIDLVLVDGDASTAGDDGLALIASRGAALAAAGSVYLGSRQGGTQTVFINTVTGNAGFEIEIDVSTGRSLSAQDFML